MIFSEKSVEDILNNKKQQTRRLVKEGENYNYVPTQLGKESRITGVTTGENNKVKWEVGRDYAVQLKRGGKGLWYCPKCKVFCGYTETVEHKIGCYNSMKPLRVVVTGIRKERLLDISPSSSKKEGYENISDFLLNFRKLNGEVKNIKDINPWCWVLNLKVLKNEL